jgi:hypothetical protein
MRAGVIVLLAAALLGGCTQPLVKQKVVSFQEREDTAADWRQMASNTAAKVLIGLKQVPVHDAAGHVLDGSKPAATLAQRPIYVRPLDSTMPFSDAFRELLIEDLMAGGATIALRPEGATVLNYDVQLFRWEPRTPVYTTGTATLVSALGFGVAKAAQVSAGVGFLAAGAAADVVLTVAQALSDRPDTEVLVTTAVVDDRAYLFRSAGLYYINAGDAWMYQSRFATPPARPMPTGPEVPYQTPTRTFRVVAQQ